MAGGACWDVAHLREKAWCLFATLSTRRTKVHITMASDYATQLETKLRALSLTPEAARWVMKALDPVRGGPAQIPDAVQFASLVPEYKTTTVIGAPPGVGTSNWDCIIISPPSDTVACYYATNVAGIDFSNAVAAVNGLVNNCPVAIGPDDALPTASFVVPTGVVGAPHSYRQSYSVELPAAWRTVARSTTVYATGSELYNQGTVYAAQYARKAMRSLGQALQVSPGSQDVVFNLDDYALPLREQDMAVLTPGFYTAAAKEGVYSVHRLTGPAQELVTMHTPTVWRASAGGFQEINLGDPTNSNMSCMHYPRFLQDNYTQVSPVVPPALGVAGGSSGFDDQCTWGVIIFRGLHPQMTLTVKTVANLEIVPTTAAPSRQFVKPPLKFEPTAVAAYYALASELPACMAAKHNFLGSILPLLGSVASKVLPYLAPAAGTLLTSLGGQLLGGGSVSRAPPPAITAPAPGPGILRRRSASASSKGSRRSASVGRVRVKVAKKARRRR